MQKTLLGAGRSVTEMLSLIVVGIAIGCIYGLIAGGFSLVYRTTGVVNFAQGSFVMLGGMVASWLLQVLHWPYVFAVLGGIAAATLVGVVLWVAVIVPLWSQKVTSYVVVLATLVFSVIVENAMLRWRGTNPVTLPPWTTSLSFQAFGVTVSSSYVLIILAILLSFLGLTLFLKHSSPGRSMRACASNREASTLMGISPVFIGGIAMALTAALGGLGGVLITPVQYSQYNVGLTYGVFGFVAAILGGFGSLGGGVAGGILLGVMQEISSRYLSTAYSEFIAFSILIVILVVRPEGIFSSLKEAR